MHLLLLIKLILLLIMTLKLITRIFIRNIINLVVRVNVVFEILILLLHVRMRQLTVLFREQSRDITIKIFVFILVVRYHLAHLSVPILSEYLLLLFL